MIYYSLTGRTRDDILESIKRSCLTANYDDELIFYLGKSYCWQKRYLFIFFEKDIVIRASIIFKNTWEKKFRNDDLQNIHIRKLIEKS
ncbi:hypothetical protein QFZ37_003202 [Chryseobacterium ginsenosidimutans]|nr:hypothetical protein [Chryseobacterium ginsenosidimutans]